MKKQIFSDGRGQHMVDIKNLNKQRVLDWVLKYPGKTRNQYCEDLNMSPITLRNHINTLIDEGKLD
jgi:DNA-binding GntR family transcriptional regulator